MSDKLIALIPCAGSGSRFGGEVAKQYTALGEKTVLDYTLQAFLAVPDISHIVLVAEANDKYINRYLALSPQVTCLKVGGVTRAESVVNGLVEMQAILKVQPQDWILVHDAVRCCISPMLILKLINQLKYSDVGGILASKATDTVKQVSGKFVTRTLKREQIYLAQTPQMFRYALLKEALQTADLGQITDEASAVETSGHKVQIVESNSSNLKITYKEDLFVAECLLNLKNNSKND